MVAVIPRVKDLDRRQCHKWVEQRFSVDRMVEDYIRIYEKVLEQYKRKAHRQ